MAIALLIATLAMLFWVHRNDRRVYKQFAQIEDSRRRQRIFLRWAASAALIYLGVSLLGLVLLKRFDTLWQLPESFWPLFEYIPYLPPWVMLASLAAGLVFGLVLRHLLGRRKPRQVRGMNVAPLQARNRAEALHLVPLILNAGISEEIFFRLYLPWLFVESGVPPVLAFVASVAVFALAHRYQGWNGVVVTGLLGAFFAWLYLATGGLAVPMILHLMLNTTTLIVQPALRWREAHQAV